MEGYCCVGKLTSGFFIMVPSGAGKASMGYIGSSIIALRGLRVFISEPVWLNGIKIRVCTGYRSYLI